MKIQCVLDWLRFWCFTQNEVDAIDDFVYRALRDKYIVLFEKTLDEILFIQKMLPKLFYIQLIIRKN